MSGDSDNREEAVVRALARVTAIDYLIQCGSPTALPGTVIGPSSLTQAILWDITGPWYIPRDEQFDVMKTWARENLQNEGDDWVMRTYERYLPRINEITLQKILPRFPSRLRREAWSARHQYLGPFRANLLFYLIEEGLRSEGMDEAFFSRLIDVYEAGRTPCGWRGEYPEGNLAIF